MVFPVGPCAVPRGGFPFVSQPGAAKLLPDGAERRCATETSVPPHFFEPPDLSSGSFVVVLGVTISEETSDLRLGFRALDPVAKVVLRRVLQRVARSLVTGRQRTGPRTKARICSILP